MFDLLQPLLLPDRILSKYTVRLHPMLGWSISPDFDLDIEPDKLRLCNRAITVFPSRTIYYKTRDLNQISVSNQSLPYR